MPFGFIADIPEKPRKRENVIRKKGGEKKKDLIRGQPGKNDLELSGDGVEEN